MRCCWRCVVWIVATSLLWGAGQPPQRTVHMIARSLILRLLEHEENARVRTALKALEIAFQPSQLASTQDTRYQWEDPIRLVVPLQEERGRVSALLEFLHIPAVWSYAQGEGRIIALIDTGVEWWHPAFVGKMFLNAAEDRNGNGRFDPWSAEEVRNGVAGDLDGVDNDGNGIVDDVMGYDFTEYPLPSRGDWKVPDPIPEDEHGHGTAMAGVMVGETPTIITGIAKQSTLLPIKAFTAEGSASDRSIAAGILYAVLMGADCINLSYGTYYFSPLVQLAIEVAVAHGIVIVASAGNEGRGAFHFPSALNEVIAVGATTLEDRRAVFSNYGPDLDVVAPGVSVLTTQRGGGFTAVSGTSVAAALVSAAVAVLRAVHPEWGPLQIAQALYTTAIDLGAPGWDPFFGNGRIDVFAAVELPATGQIRIASPQHLAVVDKRKSAMLPVEVVVDHPEMESGMLLLLRQQSDGSFEMVDTLCRLQRCLQCGCPSLSLHTFMPGVYVLELRVLLKRGKEIRAKSRFTVIDQDPILLFTQTLPVWDGARRKLLVEAVTQQPTLMALRWRESGGSWQRMFTGTLAGQFHAFLVAPERSGRVECVLEYWYPQSEDTLRKVWQQDFALQHFPRNTFTIERDKFPAPLYWATGQAGVGDTLVAVRLSPELRFVRTQALRIAPSGKLSPVDSLEAVWIPKDAGDIDGDGSPELLLYQGSRTQIRQVGQRIFGSVIWDSDTLWGAALQDWDGDGQDELFVRSAQAYQVGKWEGGTFRFFATFPNISAPDPYFHSNFLGIPNVQIGDFDGDTAAEVAFTDSDGDLLIYQYRQGAVSLDTLIETDLWQSDGYLTAGDVDGDGLPELLWGATTFLDAANAGDAAPPVWVFRLFDGVGTNQYQVRWEAVFWGARPLSPFRSGARCFDVDRDGRAEVLLTLYPHLYLFRWRQQQLHPWFVLDSVVANTIPLVPSSLLLSRLSGVVTLHSRQPSRTFAITGLRATIVDSTTMKLRWDSLSTVTAYQVQLRAHNGWDTSFTLSGTAVVVRGLQRGERYLVRVSASDAFPDTLQILFRHSPAVQAVKVLHPRVLLFEYDAEIAPSVLDPQWLQLRNDQGQQIVPTAMVMVGDRVLAAFFDTLAGTYTGTLASFPDGHYGYTRAANFTVTVATAAESSAAFILRRGWYDAEKQQIVLQFSKVLEQASAEMVSNYALVPLRRLIAAEWQGDSIVVLRVDPATPLRPIGKPYFVFVRGVRAQDGDTLQRNRGDNVAIWVSAQPSAPVIVSPNPASFSNNAVVQLSNLAADAHYAVVRSANGEIVIAHLPVESSGRIRWFLKTMPQRPGVYIIEIYDSADVLLQRAKVLVLP